MAVHPKIGLVGGLVLGFILFGLIFFMLGRTTAGWPNLWELIAGVAVGVGIVAAVGVALLLHLPASRRLAGILHQEAVASAEGFVSAEPRVDLVGKIGVALSELRPVGIAQIEGERVDVTTEGEFVYAGTAVTVVRAEGMRVLVRPAPKLPA
jgi:membrane-bound serine protease (ClpP class)